MSARALLWLVLTVVYGSFVFWYTNTDGPLTEEEIQSVLERMAANNTTDTDLSVIEDFMRSDTGNQFVMINILDVNENPTPIGDKDTPGELLGHYMEYMYPELFKRDCHPIFAGTAVASAMDLIGIEGAENWDQGALMRYRSRRDVIDIASNPVFSERHDHKLAALTKTIAYPVEVQVSLADPRFHLATLLIILGLMLEKVLIKRSSLS